MRGHGKFERLGETLDDAAGEAFDKVAKMLGLGYPGGPKVAALSEGGNPKAFDFPRAMLKDGSFNFSFSGLETSVLYTLRKEEARMNEEQFRKDIAASFQEAVVDVLVQKTRLAVEHVRKSGGVKSIILAGGVAANLALRDRLTELGGELDIPIFLPPFEYSLDNAAMIAAAGYFRAKAGDFVDPLTLSVDPNMDIV
jgi:N6-L-threonylcarbamoyladenine synthase